MRRIVPVFVLMAAGCGGVEPASEPIRPGTRCIAVDIGYDVDALPPGTEVVADHDPGRGHRDTLHGHRMGVAKRIGFDFSDDPDAVRLVRVVILDGPDKGQIEQVVRYSIRPID